MNEEEEIEEFKQSLSLGFLIAVAVAVIYVAILDPLLPIFSYFSEIWGDTVILYLFFAFPGIISSIIFYIYSKKFLKSIIVGIMSIVAFIILFVFTSPPLR